MTATDLLFKEFGREYPITYEEFIKAGWTQKQFLEYLQRCEMLRATVIVEKSVLDYCSDDDIRSKRLEEIQDAFSDLMTAFTAWLQKFMDCTVPKVELSLYRARYHIQDRVFISPEDFRAQFEKDISTELNQDHEKDDDLTEKTLENLEKEYQRIEKALRINQEPKLSNYNDYGAIQKWASAYDSYSVIKEEYEDYLDEIKQLIELKKFSFEQGRDKLFIYVGNNQCMRFHKDKAISVTANINVDGGALIKMDIYYCPLDKRFFISQREYEFYQKTFPILPIYMVYYDEDRSKAKRKFDLEEYHPLRLAGYTVNKNAGLSTEFRQRLLKTLVINKTFSKQYIKNHLEYLISMNGRNQIMREAKEKWEDDLRFVQKINLDQQPQKNFLIEDIEKY